MVGKLILSYVMMEILFLLGGCLILVFSLVSRDRIAGPVTVDRVASILLLKLVPTTAGIVNAAMIFMTFLVVVPALFMPTNTRWLAIHGWMVVGCAIFILVLGLMLWVYTLSTRSLLSKVWASQPPQIHDLLQQRFQCCGYFNATEPGFRRGPGCSTPLELANKNGCIGPFTNYANRYLDVVFTVAFGIVGVYAFVVIFVSMVIGSRKKRVRYRQIDMKYANMG